MRVTYLQKSNLSFLKPGSSAIIIIISVSKVNGYTQTHHSQLANNLNIIEASRAEMEKLQYSWICWVWTLTRPVDGADKTVKNTEAQHLLLRWLVNVTMKDAWTANRLLLQWMLTICFLVVINNYIASNTIIGKHINYGSLKGSSIVLGSKPMIACSWNSQWDRSIALSKAKHY